MRVLTEYCGWGFDLKPICKGTSPLCCRVIIMSIESKTQNTDQSFGKYGNKVTRLKDFKKTW